MISKNAKIYIAGHRGLVGSAIFRALTSAGFTNIITRTHQELDLLNKAATEAFFTAEKPEYVYLAAAKVGGILANDTHSAEFIYDNLLIETNIIESARKSGVKKILFLGSSCIYPKLAPQPIKEEYFMTGPLEPTNEAYAIAKIAGIFMAQAYKKQYHMNIISAMPTNLYGPNDNFDLEKSHVLPAMIRKFDEANENNKKEVVLWGSGNPRREFLHVDDLAQACMFLMENYDKPEIVNIGTGEDITIAELADMVKDVVGYGGTISWDRSKPDGTPQKLLDVSKLKSLGWESEIGLKDGIRKTYGWYKENIKI
jgi:GDP-L-fucose synthase